MLDKFLDYNYQTQGHTQKLPDGLPYYAAGSTENKKAVMFISDMFGWNTGHIRNYADFLAEKGFYVMIPGLLATTSGGGSSGRESGKGGGEESSSQKEDTDEQESYFPNLFNFSKLGERMKCYAYDSNLKPKIMHLVQHMEHCGIQKTALLSFSWGSWVAARVLSDPDLANRFTCGIMIHPSITVEHDVFGGNTSELMNNIQKPLMLVPCKGDPDEYREGGALFEPLKHRLNTSKVLDMREVEHGFFPRGRLNVKKNYEATQKVIDCALEFLNNHCN